MSLSIDVKAGIINEYKTKEGDTGSVDVQVALLTRRISELTKHFKTHKKDHHSRRGLLKLVSQRKKLLSYLKDRNVSRYVVLIKRLDLRK